MTEQQKQTGGGAPRVLDASRLLAVWIETAQPNARFVYHHGHFAGEAQPELIERLQAEEVRGMLFLVQDFRTRDALGHDYIAIRSSRPAGQGDNGRVPRAPKTMAEQARAEGDRAFRSSGR